MLSAREAESIALKWLSVLLPVSAFAGVLFWNAHAAWFVALGGSRLAAPLGWTDVIAATWSAVAALAFVAAWRVGLPLKDRTGNRFALVLAAALIACAEIVARAPTSQKILWKSLASRVGPADWFMSNVAEMRLNVLKAHGQAGRDKIVLIGSSQIRAALDVAVLQTSIPDRVVLLCSVGDMDARRALFALPMFAIDRRDTALLYVSERDVEASVPILMNWMRPYATVEGSVALLRLLSAKEILSQFRDLPDLALASVSECWRDRDYLRHVLFNLFRVPVGGARESAQRKVQQDLDLDLQLKSGDVDRLQRMQFRALESLVSTLRERAAYLLVMEAQMNPSLMNEHQVELQSDLRDFLTEKSSLRGFTFLSTLDQGLNHPASEFKDATHLNAAGRGRFTAFVSSYLASHADARPTPSAD